MLNYLIRRVLYTIPIVFGVALVVFSVFHLMGGDPSYQMLGKYATEKQVIELRHELGLDQPQWVQFGVYLKQIVTFDFGRSYATKQRISDMIKQGVGPSLSVALPAFSITVLLALLISLFVSYYRGRWIDRLAVILCVFGMSLSSLAYILFGQYVLAYKMGWFPVSGYEPSFPELVSYVMMPALIWVLVSLGIDVRFFRNSILEETQQDYVRTARAKGLSEPRVFFRHVLPNSAIPIVTHVVIEIPFLIMGSLLLESFFGIPGLGTITMDAIHNSDFPVIKAMTTVNSLLYIFGNVVTDVLYAWLDPRVSLR